MFDFGTDTPKLRLILSGFRGQLAPFITVHSPDSTKSGRCPYLAAKFAGMPRGEAGSYAAESARFMGPIRANEGDRGTSQYQIGRHTLSCRRICRSIEGGRPGTGKPLLYCLADNPFVSGLLRSCPLWQELPEVRIYCR